MFPFVLKYEKIALVASRLNRAETILLRKAKPGTGLSPQESPLKGTDNHIFASLVLFLPAIVIYANCSYLSIQHKPEKLISFFFFFLTSVV